MDAQNPKRWHPKLLRGPEGWTVGMVPAKHGDWLRASDMPAAPDMAELVEALIKLPAIYAHQINTGVREVYDPLQRFYTMESVFAALAKIKEPQP